MGWSRGRGAVGVRPLLVACAAFLAGAFFGVSLAWWAAVAALPLAFWRPARAAAAGLALGLLRGAAQEQAVPFALEEEFEGVVVSPDVVRIPQGLAAILPILPAAPEAPDQCPAQQRSSSARVHPLTSGHWFAPGSLKAASPGITAICL